MASQKSVILLLISLFCAWANAFQLGLNLRGDFLSASVPYASSSSTGVGFGALVEGRLPVTQDFAATLRTGYSKLSLGRTQSFTTIVTDPNPVQVTQSVAYWAFGGEINYRLPADIFWLDGGVEYLIPLSASQNDSAAGDISFTSTDKLFFIYLGPSVLFNVGDNLDLRAGTQLEYNLGSASGSKLLGVRLTLALTMGL